eukprot:SAG22_NODE_11651_length_475_cov_1.351064_1_plen_41_part_10
MHVDEWYVLVSSLSDLVSSKVFVPGIRLMKPEHGMHPNTRQ